MACPDQKVLFIYFLCEINGIFLREINSIFFLRKINRIVFLCEINGFLLIGINRIFYVKSIEFFLRYYQIAFFSKKKIFF